MFSGIVHRICDTSTATIKSSIKKLKNNKTSGVDNVVNKFFKHAHCKLLNIVLNIGFVSTLVPFTCCIKNKGSVSDPDNYRGITLLSCTGKLFTTCLKSEP